MSIYYITSTDIIAGNYKELSTSVPALANEMQGWTVDNKILLASIYRPDIVQLSNTFSLESTTFNQVGYRTGIIKGTFDVGNWVLTFKVKSNSYYDQKGIIKFRLWKCDNPNGNNATQITSNWISSQEISFTQANQYIVQNIAWNSPNPIVFNNEYLFLEIEWYATVSGNNSSTTVYWIDNGNDIRLVTPRFLTKRNLSVNSLHTIKPNTYQIKYKQHYDNTEDSVEIGDITSVNFRPHAKIKKWGDECYLSIEYPTTKNINSIFDDIENSISWKDIDDGVEINFYGREHGLFDRSNDFEYEIILNKKPTTNVISLDINTQNLKFYYQPELTQEEIDDGAYRPEHVVGSYAVYHTTKDPIHNGQNQAEKYKMCKAFHIYRPRIIDSNNNWVWADLNINTINGKLTITIQQTFLDNAVYPITIDPDFGYRNGDVPGGTSAAAAGIRGAKYSMNAETGTATTMTFYSMSNTGGNISVGGALYNDSSGSPNNLVAADSGNATVTTTAAWYTVNLSASLTSSGVYWMFNWSGADSRNYYYDSGDTNQTATAGAGWTWETWNDPFGSVTSRYARKVSVYVTYTTGGGEGTLMRFMT